MKFYKAIPDPDRYYKVKTINSSESGNSDLLNYGSYKDTWVNPSIEVIKKGENADFISWTGNILLSDNAKKILQKILEGEAEFLPVNINGSDQLLYALNILKTVPLDTEKSIVARSRKNRIISVEEYSFNITFLKGVHIFTVEQLKGSGPIVSEELKDIIEENSINGLIFSEVFECKMTES